LHINYSCLAHLHLIDITGADDCQISDPALKAKWYTEVAGMANQVCSCPPAVATDGATFKLKASATISIFILFRLFTLF
jgi:hypothetical protein